MFNLKQRSDKPKVNLSMPMLDMPDTVYVALSVGRADLLGSTVRIEGDLGEKIGGGYINSVRIRNGDRHVAVRLIIEGTVYTGSFNWDETRFCKINVANLNLEVSV